MTPIDECFPTLSGPGVPVLEAPRMSKGWYHADSAVAPGTVGPLAPDLRDVSDEIARIGAPHAAAYQIADGVRPGNSDYTFARYRMVTYDNGHTWWIPPPPQKKRAPEPPPFGRYAWPSAPRITPLADDKPGSGSGHAPPAFRSGGGRT